jgi:hypothetical protein
MTRTTRTARRRLPLLLCAAALLTGVSGINVDAFAASDDVEPAPIGAPQNPLKVTNDKAKYRGACPDYSIYSKREQYVRVLPKSVLADC